MNISSLPVYYSKASLSVRYADYTNVYELPSICAFGIVTSILCIIPSLKRDESSAKAMDYILLNSLIDLVFLLLELFTFIIRCGTLCPYGYTFFAKFYEIYFFQFTGYILVQSQVFLSIYVTYDRLTMFSAKNRSKKKISIYYVYIICCVLGALANAIPYATAKEVLPFGVYKTSPNETSYEVLYLRGYRPAFTTQTASLILTIILALKNPCLFSFLCFLNVYLCVRFRVYMKSRQRLIKRPLATEQSAMTMSNSVTNNNEVSSKRDEKSMSRKESNFTLLTLLYCLVYCVGNFIDCFAMMAGLFNFDIYVQYGFINILGNSLFFFSHGVHLFLYYFFNNEFKKKFNEIFFRSS